MHNDIVSHVLKLKILILVTLLSCTVLFISFDVLIMTQEMKGIGQSCIFLTKGPKSVFREEAIAFFFLNALNSFNAKLC